MTRIHAVLVAAALALLAPLPLTAQTLIGRVVDAESDKPVAAADVTVRLAEGRELARAITDDAGWFMTALHGVEPPADLVLEVRRIGYEGAQATGLRLEGAGDLRVDLRLRPRAVELPGIEVVVRQAHRHLAMHGFYRRQAVFQGVFMEAADIDATRARWSHQLFSNVSGFRLADGGADGLEPVSARGAVRLSGRPCWPAIYLDGMRVRASEQRYPSLNNIISPENIGAIEIYRGPATAPQEFSHRGGTACGLIVIWTRY